MFFMIWIVHFFDAQNGFKHPLIHGSSIFRSLVKIIYYPYVNLSIFIVLICFLFLGYVV